MARSTEFRKPKATQNETDPDLLAHIRALGLEAVEDYRAWCERNGFSPRTQKHWRERCKERFFATKERAEARLARKRDERRNPGRVIRRIFDGQLPESDLTEPHLVQIAAASRSLGESSSRQSLLKLLLHAQEHARLFSLQRVISTFGEQAGNTFVEALAALARHHEEWIRPVELWKPRTHNSHRQFSSLARHLFARYELPEFMDCVWFKGPSPDAAQQQGWFKHLGLGQNIRRADLPLHFTKRMAHHFMRAPKHFTVEEALRWGQIHGLGGDARTVGAVLTTRLARSFEHEDFWASVIQWLISSPMLDPAQLGPMIDYIQNQKFVPQDLIVAPGVVEQRPAQPNFSIKARTPESLMRQMREWHRELGEDTKRPEVTWMPSGIDEFSYIERDPDTDQTRYWTIRELLRRSELVSEGRKLRHCVASYADSCRTARSSIWSLGVQIGARRKRILTIEVVSRTKQICQVRGKANRLPSEREKAILRRWAAEQGLTLGST